MYASFFKWYIEAISVKCADPRDNYLTANRLSINIGKTEILRVGYRLGKAEDDSLVLAAVDSKGDQIRPPEDCRLLGVRLSRDLKWNDHIQSD